MAGHPGAGKPRARTGTPGPAPVRVTLEDLREGAEHTPLDALRPRKRSDCLPGGSNAERPCPWVSCKHHLYLDVNPSTGTITINFPHLDVDQLPETCERDVSDRGGESLEEVGRLVNVGRQRVHQIEAKLLIRLRRAARKAGLSEQDVGSDGQMSSVWQQIEEE